MSEPSILSAPAVEILPPPRGKWEREYQAFRRLLPELLRECSGQYVAIHNEQVVGRGPDKLALALDVLARIGNCAIHVGRVSAEPEPVSRSGVRREISPAGDAA